MYLAENYNIQLTNLYNEKEVSVFDVTITAINLEIPKPITIKWEIPAHNVKGVWKPTTDFSKRIQADWELDDMESRISIDAPIISLFGHDDTNRHTFACSDAINKLELNAKVVEEDDSFYCFVRLFTEHHAAFNHYNMQIRIDSRTVHFSQAIKGVSQWWETFDNLHPSPVPESALLPLYSTWYNFHQNLDSEELIKECKLAYQLGYKVIIIDDGWQTNDNNRGYDYTGDWNPKRFQNTKAFVAKIHDLGMKVGFWYSVPFCGKKSKAYTSFKGKFLTENHRWAPVFDPRYPEVREYLINTYRKALVDWDLDGFKFDFIDDFNFYPDTVKEKTIGMDYHSINDALDRLLTDMMSTLRYIKPDIFIEFRQKYTGPAMRKYGNMFRAFDCPGDATMNRVRIADIKMLLGNTAVHSDMVTWHKNESLEIATLHILNTLFGVPQISVILQEMAPDYLKMIKFYTAYWTENKTLILSGKFTAFKPLSNYPVKQVYQASQMIVGVFDDYMVEVKQNVKAIDFINAKLSTTLMVKPIIDLGVFNYIAYNCKGDIVDEGSYELNKGLLDITCPACGLIKLTQKT